MNTLVQHQQIKPRSDKVRIAAQTVKSVMTESPFLFNWKFVMFDLAIIALWLTR